MQNIRDSDSNWALISLSWSDSEILTDNISGLRNMGGGEIP